MPVIPRRDAGPVNLNPLPGNRVASPAPIEAFGGQYAEDLGQVGKAVGNVADKLTDQFLQERNAADQAAVNDVTSRAEIELNKFETESWAERSKRVGPNRADDVGFAGHYEEGASRIINGALSGVNNPRQRKILEKWASERAARARSKAYELEGKATDEAFFDIGTRTMAAGEQDVVANWDRPRDVDAGIATINSGIDNVAIGKRLTPEQTAELKRKAAGAVAKRLIEQALDAGDEALAGMYIGKFSTKDANGLSPLSSDDVDEFRKVTDEKRWERDADGIYAASGGSMEKALKAVGDGPGRDEKIKRITQRFREDDYARQRDTSEANRIGERELDETGRISTNTFRRMDPSVREALLDRNNKRKAGVPEVSDTETFGALMGALANPTLREQMKGGYISYRKDKNSAVQKVPIDLYRAKLTDLERGIFDNAYREMFSGKGSKEVVQQAEQVGAVTAGMSPADKAAFLGEYYQAAAAELTPETNTYENRKKIIARLMVPTDGAGPYFKVRAAAIAEGVPLSEITFKIPDDVRKRLFESIKAGKPAGGLVSPEEVEAAYKAELGIME